MDPAALRAIGVVHDLRAPLRTALAELALIKAKRESAAFEDGLDAVERHLVGMQARLEDLLAIAAPEPPVRVDLAAVAREAADTVGAPVHIEALGHIVGAPAIWARILENLIGNAAEHGDGLIEVRRAGSELHVRDEGDGLPEPIIAAIHGGQPIPREGVHGLGMELVRTMCETEGARLQVRGGHPVVTLPAYQEI